MSGWDKIFTFLTGLKVVGRSDHIRDIVHPIYNIEKAGTKLVLIIWKNVFGGPLL